MSNMQDVLNTYEGAKPSRLHNDSGDSRSPFSYFASSLYDPAYDSSGGGSTVGGGGNSTTSWYDGEDPQGFCGPGTQRACFWVILATSFSFFALVLLFTWLVHYMHSAKAHKRAHEYRRRNNIVNGSTSAAPDETAVNNDDSRVDSDQVFEDIVSVQAGNPV